MPGRYFKVVELLPAFLTCTDLEIGGGVEDVLEECQAMVDAIQQCLGGFLRRARRIGDAQLSVGRRGPQRVFGITTELRLQTGFIRFRQLSQQIAEWTEVVAFL